MTDSLWKFDLPEIADVLLDIGDSIIGRFNFTFFWGGFDMYWGCKVGEALVSSKDAVLFWDVLRGVGDDCYLLTMPKESWEYKLGGGLSILDIFSA